MIRHRFDRTIWLILAALALLVVAIIAAGSRIGAPGPVLPVGAEMVSARGPLRLEFPQSVQRDSVETRLSVSPASTGFITWTSVGVGAADTLEFRPDIPWQPGQFITVHLASGTKYRDGRVIRNAQTWQVQIRRAEVLYLSPVDTPELWRISGDGPARVLSRTGGKIYDYSVSPGGDTIYYSVLNDQDGIDLWSMARDGSGARELLPCGGDWCINPSASIDGVRLAYSRRQAGESPGEGPGVPRLWMVDLITLETAQVYPDPNIGGYEPVWSPDGRWLAFFDGLSGGVRVHDFETGSDTLLPSQMGMAGAWSPDETLYFMEYEAEVDLPSAVLYVFDPRSGTIERAFDGAESALDYGLPAISPDGSQAALALRPITGGATRQIWLMRLDGSGRSLLIEDALHHYAAYNWDPSGGRLLFQRLEANRSDSLPQVVVWEGDAPHVLADDAYQPRWLP